MSLLFENYVGFVQHAYVEIDTFSYHILDYLEEILVSTRALKLLNFFFDN